MPRAASTLPVRPRWPAFCLLLLVGLAASGGCAQSALFGNRQHLPTGTFTLHLASLRTEIAFNPRWSWINLVQYNNADEAIGINSRLRYVPEAGREMILVLNHNSDVDPHNRFASVASELNLKLHYTFRY